MSVLKGLDSAHGMFRPSSRHSCWRGLRISCTSADLGAGGFMAQYEFTAEETVSLTRYDASCSTSPYFSWLWVPCNWPTRFR